MKDYGSISYTPEKGDNAKTLYEQYKGSLTEEQANDLYNNHRDWDGSISGESVEYVTKKSQVLKLSTFSDKQKNLDQIMFAMKYSMVNNTQVDGVTVMKTQDFFDVSDKTMAFDIEGNGRVNINGANVNIRVILDVKTTMNGWSSKEVDRYLAYSVRINNDFDKRSDDERAKYSFDNSYFRRYIYYPNNGNPYLKTNRWSYVIFSTPKNQTRYFINFFN